MQVCTSCRRLLRADASRCPDDGAATDTVWTLPKDTRLGAYRIDRMLGEGGMGFVYEATHEVLNRRSAIKIRLLSPPGGPSLRRRYRKFSHRCRYYPTSVEESLVSCAWTVAPSAQHSFRSAGESTLLVASPPGAHMSVKPAGTL